jgi:L-fuculose-phosphate aldolase
MNNTQTQPYKKEIIAAGRLLWEKNLASGLNGNISHRIDKDSVLLTAHGTCLGNLEAKDILGMKLDGEMLDGGTVSTEKMLHTEIYKNFPDAKAVIHTHTTYTNAFFLKNEILTPQIFESKICLGEVKAVAQATPAVTDATPVIDALRRNNIAVLRNHGVVAKGEALFDCFLLIQALEEAVKTEAVSRLFQGQDGKGRETGKNLNPEPCPTSLAKKYQLFSQDQIDEIVRLVNADSLMKELGEKTKMTMDLAVKLNETGQTHSFRFENGRIASVGHDENVEFLITAPEAVWRSVFNREIDPFVATTQKKMNLRGDFAKISRWYAPCSRVFELWQQVPVE